MSKDTVVALRQPGEFEDLLTDVLRQGARKLLAQAVEAEVADFLATHADLTTEDGRQRLVRHGHLPERTIQTGMGSVEVQQPRVRDRGSDGEKIRFSPAILPPYARRSKSLVQRRIHKIQMSLHDLFGFASIFPNRPDRSVWIDA